MKDPQPVKSGDMVHVVDENYLEHSALVTTVHGAFPDPYEEGAFVPCINVVYVSADPGKRDPYGAQVERMTSLQHRIQARGMPKPGRYWENV